MHDRTTLSLPIARTPEAERMLSEFKTRYKTRLERMRNTPLHVLVWGPGTKSSSPVRNKRIQIRDDLLRRGHNAMFSEELKDIGDDLPTKIQELAQIQEAHLVISLLEDAPGALAEAHDFANRQDTASKFFFLIPKKYQGGYSAKGAILILSQLFNCVHWYDEGEIQNCTVLTQALRRVRLVQALVSVSG
ncbi:MAG: hypothetical protein HZC40_13715 [Chloroflexi bacterium]|nr:hypothetical protein [Chloroflexota bacterium]